MVEAICQNIFILILAIIANSSHLNKRGRKFARMQNDFRKGNIFSKQKEKEEKLEKSS